LCSPVQTEDLEDTVTSICVFCGSSLGDNEDYARAARDVGTAVAELNMKLVYGGGRRGLMGILANAALDAGAPVVGVITRHLVDRELAHQELTALHVVEDMHSRKAAMAALADGFIAMPGGFGTLEEILEVLSWSQLGLHAKPVGFLEVAAFWKPLLAFFDRQVEAGFVSPESRRRLFYAEQAATLLSEMSETTNHT